MYPPFLSFIILSTLISLCTTFPSFLPSTHASLDARSALTDCQNVLDNGLNSTCYDTLKVDAWVKRWNLTTKTCQRNELWANCFMREAGVPPEEGLGCAQMGPNTCNEPTVDLVANASAEQVYTAVSIWSLQQLYTAIYNDLQADNGTTYISEAWGNLTAPITGRSLLAKILFADEDPRTQFMGLQVLANVTVSGVDNTPIATQAQAPRVLGQVLASYLESSMTNFTLGGYWGMANHGKLVV